jgi:hypothetical protein
MSARVVGVRFRIVSTPDVERVRVLIRDDGLEGLCG